MAVASPTSTASTPTPPESAAPPVPGLDMSHTFAPFSGLAVEFNSDLELVSANIGDNQTREVLKAKPAVTPSDKTKPYLPGQPRIRLDRPLHNGEDPVLKYVQGSHLTTQLDELLPFMRYIFVQTPSYIHIMALHHQKAHARKIVVDESPGLHLVWYYEFIFIKPVPAYFYSRAFWTYIQNADEKVYHASLGFMRSYYWLIQYEIDYLDALAQHLIPRKGDGAHPTYEEWCAFIEPFGQVGDKSVSRRFHYGELRLTRINRAAFLFKRKLAYFHIYPQWGSFLAHFLAPIITVFAVCSVVLNSMQVTLAALEADRGATPGAWPRFLDASVWFPVVVMLGIAVVMVASLVGVGVMGVGDLVRGNVVRARKKKGDPRAGGGSHGMVW